MDINYLQEQRLPSEVREHVHMESIVELFEILDTEGVGQVSENEFVHGMLKLSLLKLHRETPETFQLLKLTRACRRMSSDTQELLQRIYSNQCQQAQAMATKSSTILYQQTDFDLTTPRNTPRTRSKRSHEQ